MSIFPLIEIEEKTYHPKDFRSERPRQEEEAKEEE